MTNEQIIAEAAISIYGEEKVRQMVESGMEIPLHTALGWRMRGPYRVKDGEFGVMTKLWKMRKCNDTDGISDKQEFYLSKAILFSEEQVEKVEDGIQEEI